MLVEGDDELEQVADDLLDAIYAAFESRPLFPLSRRFSQRLIKQRLADPSQLGRELGASHTLSISLRPRGDELRHE